MAFKKAKQIKPGGSDMLMSLLGGSIAAKLQDEQKDAPGPVATWCRNGEGSTDYGVYRSDGSPADYVLAL